LSDRTVSINSVLQHFPFSFGVNYMAKAPTTRPLTAADLLKSDSPRIF